MGKMKADQIDSDDGVARGKYGRGDTRGVFDCVAPGARAGTTVRPTFRVVFHAGGRNHTQQGKEGKNRRHHKAGTQGRGGGGRLIAKANGQRLQESGIYWHWRGELSISPPKPARTAYSGPLETTIPSTASAILLTVDASTNANAANASQIRRDGPLNSVPCLA
ncbi:hypothetical protein CCHR01_12920 [Colletotrichum chrysophilum]|uniref:Uncharacterized protein n=1 Tax=Colletotrichum chrysophilum TaxID=1836956 RepID=A0AAD9AD89_9PEZI|nr:hypothetical protein CCHR01_12920 [Colletotrichum chrysophilum]